MIKAVTGNDGGVAVSINADDMKELMDEFTSIVSSLFMVHVDAETPVEIIMMGIQTAVLTGFAKALAEFEDDDEEEDQMMDIIREALKKEHEGE